MKAMAFSNDLAVETVDRTDPRPNGLKIKTEAAPYAEVVKNALRPYAVLAEKTESGTLTPRRLFS